METVDLSAEPRSETGKGAGRRLRRAGKSPAIFYGPKRPATLIVVDAKEFLLKIASLEGSHLIRLQSPLEDLANKVALVKDAQYDPVSGNLLHADLYEVDMAAKLRVRAPLHFTGK